jgi:hypothetical protein
MTRAMRFSVVLVAAFLGLAGVVPVPGPAAPGADQAAARSVGKTPLDDILFWADQAKACGLSRDRLAAMMLAPTYPETGASGTAAPSPMTLSRWDTQSRLYAFADRSTPWQRAFWHPGVGMWQFDSAGFWNLTAGGKISTWSSAQQAASTMAQRWCANPTRRHVWAPWYACASSTVCEDIYNFIFDGIRLRNLTTLTSVSREGGMVNRTCRFGTVNVVCSYVDPNRAQGHRGWVSPGAGPSPITAPFYVVSYGGREYRFWLREDTGYPFTIRADKPITANARTSLVWNTSVELCDLTAARGDCGAGPRVATTPWGPRSQVPFGSFDSATSGSGSINLTGWAIDPDTNDPIDVHVFVDWVDRGRHRADRVRSDVAAVVPGYGDRHGFSVKIAGIGTGPKQVCIWAVNVGPHGNHDPLLGCRTVTISANPFGHYDTLQATPSGVRLTGWSIDPDTQSPTDVHVYVDDRYAGLGVANRPRPDVFATFGWAGPDHGFQIDINANPGLRKVCAFAINIGPGRHTFLGCKSVVVPDHSPFGSLDVVTRSNFGVRVAGWAIDRDTTGPIDVHVYVNGSFAGVLPADRNRPDVGAAFPAFGPNHGFDAVVGAPGPPARVCVYAINVGPGNRNPLLGCRDA